MKTTDEELQSMKVDDKYVREAIEEYKQTIASKKNEDAQKYPTVQKNGATYYVVNMTIEEFCKLKNAKNMNDIQWTM